ncbi:UDP-glucose 4-epimerase GalE [Arsenicitalea aurantiaca]|uniref:UDP-glucose 4-epimerase n=2 Tax=Arsenicitalea aurantiaca TaxID=1783274 RepID=A0A433XL77_9HYPH|nr:UDP-glucose 4-epimerase GalE [Arsenicitalea aurantiaca]RUT34823.1 UDP-glucose 4-epimerase GalE [Arsenicitalea aurantiaca]
MMTSVLVTGGAGFIGSHACKALSRAGYRPIAYDSLETGHRDAVLWGPLVVGDIADRALLGAAIATHRPVAIMHFAAYAYVGESVREPARYYRNNVGGTLALLETAASHGVEHIVFSSSCATYGVPDAMPILETTPQRPINPYGRTKLIGEVMLRDFCSSGAMRHVALRYFNAAGADPEGALAERHDPETHLIPRALMAAAGAIPALEIFGGDYPTPDGTCIRDYIHVSDLADAHVAALDYLLAGGSSTALNIGTGTGHSVRDILSGIEALTGRAVPSILHPRRAGDPPMLVADPRRAREILGFSPRHSDLGTILATAARSFGLRRAA